MMSTDSKGVMASFSEFISNIDTVWDYFAIFGICCGSAIFVRWFIRSFSAIRSYFLTRYWHSDDFPSKFGGKWAVITGASDGIGRSYAFNLAKRKMNVFLISRNQNKLDKVACEIKSKYDVITSCYPLDLCEINEGNNYDELKSKIDELDVGVLVNNVGLMYDELQYFLTVPKQRHLNIINLNINPTVSMTYMVLPKMLARKCGAIINVSSGAAVQPTPLMTTYSASKSFIDSFTTALEFEYSSYGILMQLVRPFYVSTNMTNKAKPNILIADADTYVESALCSLGVTKKTYGHWSHGIMGLVGEMVPEWFYLFGCVNINSYLWSWLTGGEVAHDKVN